jgi:hypothetical protein
MRKFGKPTPKPQASGAGEIWAAFLFVAAGLGVLYWYYKHHASGGTDLWTGLGFGYGALGNLPGIASDFKTGNVTGLSPNGAALPVQMNQGAASAHTLTDIGGTILTDRTTTGLTDVNTNPPPTLFQARNAAGIRISLNSSGSRPS